VVWVIVKPNRLRDAVFQRALPQFGDSVSGDNCGFGHANEAQCVSLLDGDGDDAEVGGGSFGRDGSRLGLMLLPFPRQQTPVKS